jgi:hypothetical protein
MIHPAILCASSHQDERRFAFSNPAPRADLTEGTWNRVLDAIREWHTPLAELEVNGKPLGAMNDNAE